MSNRNYELKLYRLIAEPNETYEECLVSELGWISDTEFCVWIDYFYVHEFMKELTNICGHEVFDEGGFNANMQSDGICIDLVNALYGYGFDFERMFPKDKYRH